MYVEAVGRKQSGKEKELHHLEIHGHEDATPESPRWIVLHNFGPEHEPQGHEFTNHEQMIEHVRQHSAADGEDEA
jgi:hypothetical protein